MQTLREIRRLLGEAALRPRKQLGQSFLIDGNLLGKLVELAELTGGETVLEVGPGTGSLTEELLDRAARVVAVEIDRGLCDLLRRRLGERENFKLIGGDVLAGKHALSPAVLDAVGPGTHLVSNLPYQIATPLLVECLVQSWRAARGAGRTECGFQRLTFTVQREVADRLTASPGGRAYGPVSVVIALLGHIRLGPTVPASAFWPRPKVAGRIVRIDFDRDRAKRLGDCGTLTTVLGLSFGQRRKQIGSVSRRASAAFGGPALEAALAAAGIDPTSRPEAISPEQFLTMANALGRGE
ncbi:MAG: 16S rRNA (adenine(1518)-N(6)/adenine(1519)-N(6))-dimethyltransferase RsmA [Phycisphaerae bacterium]